MPKILELNTQETLYPEPLEVVIDGKTFRVAEADLGTLEKLQELYAQALLGRAAALREILELVLGKDESGAFGKLKVKQVKTLIETVLDRLVRPDEVEKNGPSPGEAGLP